LKFGLFTVKPELISVPPNHPSFGRCKVQMREQQSAVGSVLYTYVQVTNTDGGSRFPPSLIGGPCDRVRISLVGRNSEEVSPRWNRNSKRGSMLVVSGKLSYVNAFPPQVLEACQWLQSDWPQRFPSPSTSPLWSRYPRLLL
jgi:hypothetical protein